MSVHLFRNMYRMIIQIIEFSAPNETIHAMGNSINLFVFIWVCVCIYIRTNIAYTKCGTNLDAVDVN